MAGVRRPMHDTNRPATPPGGPSGARGERGWARDAALPPSRESCAALAPPGMLSLHAEGQTPCQKKSTTHAPQKNPPHASPPREGARSRRRSSPRPWDIQYNRPPPTTAAPRGGTPRVRHASMGPRAGRKGSGGSPPARHRRVAATVVDGWGGWTPNRDGRSATDPPPGPTKTKTRRNQMRPSRHTRRVAPASTAAAASPRHPPPPPTLAAASGGAYGDGGGGDQKGSNVGQGCLAAPPDYDAGGRSSSPSPSPMRAS